MIEINIKPRGTGKTRKIVRRFMENIQETNNNLLLQPPILLVVNEEMKRLAENYIAENWPAELWKIAKKHIYSVGNKAWLDRGYNPAKGTTFIDEYLMLSRGEKRKLYRALNRIGRNIVIYTTADRLYNRNLIRNIQLMKQMHPSFIARIGIAPRLDDDEFDLHYFNFISEPDVEIKTDDRFEDLPKEHYATMVLGRVFEEENDI